MSEKIPTRLDFFPGYEQVVVIEGSDFMSTMALVEHVLDDQGIGTECPGIKNGFTTLLVLDRHAARARELIKNDARLKGRWLAMLDEHGEHPVT